MIFDTIYEFFLSLFSSYNGDSPFWDNGVYVWFGDDNLLLSWADYFSVLGTVIVISLGVVALFKILGGVLRLVKPW